MKPSALITVVALVAIASSAMQAQAPSKSSPAAPAATAATAASAQKPGSLDPRDSVGIAAVRKAADDLVIAVQKTVKTVTENPELKVAALKLATSSVNAAQVVVTQQAATLQSALESLAKEMAVVTATEQRKIKTH